jgi:hypothetical protein
MDLTPLPTALCLYVISNSVFILFLFYCEIGDLRAERGRLMPLTSLGPLLISSHSKININKNMIGDHARAQGCGQWREVHGRLQVQPIVSG